MNHKKVSTHVTRLVVTAVSQRHKQTILNFAATLETAGPVLRGHYTVYNTQKMIEQ